MYAQPAANSFFSVRLADYLTLSLLGLVFVPVAAFTLLLMLGMGESRWCLPLMLAAAWPPACLRLLRAAPRRSYYGTLALLILLVAGSALLTGFGYDASYDGMAYHSDAIYSLLRGDNPYYGGLTGNEQGFDYWTLHYPKATWYFAALVIHATSVFQLGKLYHFLLIGAVFFYVAAFCRRRSIGKAGSLLMAGAAAFGPVQMAQIWTYYVDGALGSALTLLIFSGLNLLRSPRKVDALVFTLSGLLLINIKFTGVVYALIVAGAGSAFLLWHWLKLKEPGATARVKLWVTCIAVVFIAGVPFMGFDPYVSNTIIEGNPMYPLAGAHPFDAITKLMPPVFRPKDVSRFTRLAESVFCRGVFISKVDLAPVLKWPFAVSLDDIKQFKEPDVKISGWGVLFSGLLIAGGVLYGLSRGWLEAEASFAIVMILATVLVNPHAWWARFAPQLALVPLFLALPALQSPRFAAWAKAFFVLCLLNALLVLLPSTIYYRQQEEMINAQTARILGDCGPGTYEVYGTTPFHYEQFLESRGIVRQGIVNGAHPPKGAFPFRELYLSRKNCR